MAKTLSATRLREVLSYHPATGIFRWRGAGNPHVKADQVAGCARSRGPVVICVDRKLYRANRLAWLYMTGKWPKFEVGFINRNASDIRWQTCGK